MTGTSTSGRPPAADCNLLWALSGNICAAPDCSAELTSRSTSRTITLGEIAHISASSKGGPRYDPDLTQSQRDSYENTLLLCRDHHRLIDASAEDFPKDILIAWKQQHEGRRRSQPFWDVQRHGLLQPPVLPSGYVPRPILASQIREHVAVEALALVGLSGAGKTLMATEAAQSADEYRFRFWLRGRSQTTLEIDLAALGTYLGIANDMLPSHEAASLVLNHLDAATGIFLIIDDLDDVNGETLSRLANLPHLLITSRMAFPALGLSTMAMPKLTPAEAGQILSASPQLADAGSQARDLAATLCEHLPLAVAQFASFSAATGMDAQEQLALMRERRGHLLDRGEVGHPTLSSSLRMAWERLTPSARELAGAVAQLADGAVPHPSPGSTAAIGVPFFEDPLEFEDAIAELRRYSLVDRFDGVIRMHSLVRDVISTELSTNTSRDLVIAAYYLHGLIPSWTDRADNWAIMDVLEPHLELLIHSTAQLDATLAASLANKLGPYLESRGRLNEARSILEDSLARIEIDDDPGLAGSLMQNLANVLADLGLHDDALHFMGRSVRLKETAFGRDHALTAVGHAGLGNLLHSVGRGEEAIQHYEWALGAYERMDEKSGIAETLIDLATLHLPDDSALAEALLDRAGAIVEAIDEPFHLSHSLAMLYSLLHEVQGRLPAAAKSAAKAVTLARSLGSSSKELAQSLALHGRLLLHLGVDRGITLLEESCQVFSDIGSERSVDAARANGNLGLWLVQFYVDFHRGNALLRDSLGLLEELLPEESESVWRARLMLAEALPFVGRFDEAMDLATRVRDHFGSGDLRESASDLVDRLLEFKRGEACT